MKKVFALVLMVVFGIASGAQAVTLAAVLQLGGLVSPDPAYKSVSAHYTISDSVAPLEIPDVSADEIMLPLATPGTWKSLIVAAIVADASTRGFTLTASNVRWIVYEAGDYKETKLWASWPDDATKTNLSASLVNVYPGLGGEQQLVDFGGYTQYRWVVYWNKVGLGTQVVQLVDAGNTANFLTWSDTAAAGEHSNDTGWTNLSAWMVGEKLLKAMASSTNTADDPICRGVYLYLR